MYKILIVEDESIIRSTLARLLERNKFQTSQAENVDQACEYNFDDFDLIISDVRMPGRLGTELINLASNTPVLIMTSFASMRAAIDAIKLGAIDYIAKPFDHQEMIECVNKILQDFKPQTISESPKTKPSPKPSNEFNFSDFIGSSQVMKTFYRQCERVAKTDVTILITGESGTGKELAARAIALHSNRNEKPFVSVNCAAIAQSLIESELFGHEKGAFTGAVNTNEGLILAANHGTLFLDEIGELPLEAQARLLRVMQEQEIRKVGSSISKKINVRFLCATHRNLKKLVEQGLFREDLYYRIQVIELHLSSLKDRGNDVIEIAQYLLKKHSKKLNILVDKTFTTDSLSILRQYPWPGNVRELENAVQRSLILSNGVNIEPVDLGIDYEFSELDQTAMDTQDLDFSEKEIFTQYVMTYQNNLSETQLAQQMGVSRKCLWERRQRFDVPRNKN
ncbi:sigma-54-dependent transcriptional regulator [Marinicellulosiphila megalodicopiae]|uniref:sigma-54-dependent transcriptional regulator n=1 Tax=Marinicellulosiphila megalodicopiae TaxID=2724896 RepID=UPI003BAF4776